jgi:5-formyltetrahydrofolate cyclo-ligase
LPDALSRAKQTLRHEIGARRREVSLARARAAGDALARRVLALLRQRPCVRVALYAALRDELPLSALFDALLASGQRPLLPRIRGEVLDFAPVRSRRDLRAGPYGVQQPPLGARPEPLRRGDLVLVPGVAFDRAGHRLGRGAGFYDRTFGAACPGPLLIGAAYEFQICPAVPHGSRDRRVDAIVTEYGMLWPRGRR